MMFANYPFLHRNSLSLILRLKKVDFHLELQQPFIPPLRLVLNRHCNGNCPFCHHEGYKQNIDMPIQMVGECAAIANELSVPDLSLTGGEPTLRQDLREIVEVIQGAYGGRIGLTTNGYKLSELCNKIKRPLHTINLSITSFKENIYERYQNTNPVIALDALQAFPAHNKNLNIVVIEENYHSITDIIAYCLDHSLSADLMFELKQYSTHDVLMQQYVIQELLKIGKPEIKYSITPTFVITVNEKCKISIKHPLLSSLVSWSICQQCTTSSSCFERICSIRVYPDGLVSPCLNNSVKLTAESLPIKIKKTYECLGFAKLKTMQLHEFLGVFSIEV